MPEYIEREALIEDINETVVFTVREGVHLPTSEMRGANKVIDRIKSAPTADVVLSSVLEQVRWERDMALETLKEHGIGFCEKSDMVEVVRCKDCRHFVPIILNGKVQERGYCTLGCDWVNRKETDFCNYGERKSD